MNIFKKATLISILSLSLLSSSYSIDIKTEETCTNESTNIAKTTDKQENVELILILEEIKIILDNYTDIEKEMIAISPIKLKNFTGIGLLKNFKGQITFKELKSLTSLQNNFNDNSSIEILKYIFGFIVNQASKTNTDKKAEKLTTLIAEIKEQINKQFKLNVDLEDIYLNTQNTPASLTNIFKHPTIKKILEISKSDTEKLKDFFKYLFEKILPSNSEAKKSLELIVSKADCLLFI